MPDGTTALADQFEDLEQQREASTLGMWTFLATEVIFFGCLFLGYIVYRHLYPAAFAAASQHTLLTFGTINTAVLLTSSLTMALAVHAIQRDHHRQAARFLMVTVSLGCAFLVLKGFEYHGDLADHLWPGPHFTSELPKQARIFWFLYWVMTGLHALHVTVGVGLLSVMSWLTHRGRFSVRYYRPIEVSGLYWHFVDIVWIFLYPLLYLISSRS
jgi:cytochrome c oxidase subunit 3